jgi:hypothetical protein
MNDPSQKSKPQTSKGTPSATSSQASGAGPSHLPSQGGLQLSLFGQAPVPANPSAQPDGMGGSLTNATSGLSSNASLRSADLQLSLENRLAARLEDRGSLEYALTWKAWPMESGPPICALRASAHRISDNASSGWPTPTATERSGVNPNTGQGAGLSLTAHQAGWPTPSASQFEQNPEAWEKRRQRNLAKGYNGNGQGATLDIAAHQAGWPTPNAADSWTPPHTTENTLRRGDPNGTLRSTSGSLAKDVVMKVPGQTPSPFPASTAKNGVLNPEFVRWLMGFPAEWGNYAPTATPSSRTSQQNS